MPPPEVFKFLDIREAYLLAPGFWDPLIFTMFLYFVILYAFQSAKYIKKGGWEGGLGEDKKEVKRMQRALAFIMALMTSLGFTVYGNLSLRMLFTTGAYQTVIAVFIGVWAYGAILKRQKERNRLMALALAFFIGSIVYAFFIGQRTRAGSWMDALFDLAVLAIFIGAMGFAAGGKRARADASKGFSDVDSDLGKARKNAGSVGSGLGKALGLALGAAGGGAKIAGAIGKWPFAKVYGSLQALKKRFAMKKQAYDVAYRMFAKGSTREEIRSELSQIEVLGEKIPAKMAEKVLDKVMSLPKGAPAPPATLSSDDAQEILDFFTMALSDYEKIQKKIENELINPYKEIISLTDQSVNKLGELTESNGTTLRDMEKSVSDAKTHVEEIARNPDMAKFAGRASKLHEAIATMHSTFKGAVEGFNAKNNAMVQFLSTAEIASAVKKLRESLDALEKTNAGLKAKIIEIKKAGDFTESDIVYCDRALPEANRLFGEVKNIIERYKRDIEVYVVGGKNVVAIVEEFVTFITPTQATFKNSKKESEELKSEIKGIAAAKKAEAGKPAEVLRLADTIAGSANRMKDYVRVIETIEFAKLTKKDIGNFVGLLRKATIDEFENTIEANYEYVNKTLSKDTPKIKEFDVLLSDFLTDEKRLGKIKSYLSDWLDKFNKAEEEKDLDKAKEIISPYIGVIKSANYSKKLGEFESAVREIRMQIAEELASKP